MARARWHGNNERLQAQEQWHGHDGSGTILWAQWERWLGCTCAMARARWHGHNGTGTMARARWHGAMAWAQACWHMPDGTDTMARAHKQLHGHDGLIAGTRTIARARWPRHDSLGTMGTMARLH